MTETIDLGNGIKQKHIKLHHGYEIVNEYNGVEDNFSTYYAQTFANDYEEFAIIDRDKKIIYFREDLQGILTERTLFKMSRTELLTKYIDYSVKSYNINEEDLV